MTERYSPYRSCPKCGAASREIGTAYIGSYGGGSLRRSCGRCGYHWIELPLDSSPSEPARPATP